MERTPLDVTEPVGPRDDSHGLALAQFLLMGVEVALLIARDIGDGPEVEAALICDFREVGMRRFTSKLRPT